MRSDCLAYGFAIGMAVSGCYRVAGSSEDSGEVDRLERESDNPRADTEDSVSDAPKDTELSTAGKEIVQVAVGADFSCHLMRSGDVACWGAGGAGQCLPPKRSFVQITAGGRHACGLDAVGKATCWGANGKNQGTPPDENFCGDSGRQSPHLRVDGGRPDPVLG